MFESAEVRLHRDANAPAASDEPARARKSSREARMHRGEPPSTDGGMQRKARCEEVQVDKALGRSQAREAVTACETFSADGPTQTYASLVHRGRAARRQLLCV